MAQRIRAFLCNWLDWHKPLGVQWNGLSLYSRCRHCKREILQDSQGNWFRLSFPQPQPPRREETR